MEMGTPFTLAKWLVKPGQEEAFVEAWKRLGKHFYSLPQPPGPGTLLRSTTDPRLFYSFGSWPSAEAVAAMRAHPRTGEVMGKVTALCEEATPGGYTVVAVVGE